MKEPPMNRKQLIKLAEKHGYGENAARVLHSLSPAMRGALTSHAAMIDANDGKDLFLIEKAQTRRALWARELLAHKTGTHRVCGISELGYRVIGLLNLSRVAREHAETPANEYAAITGRLGIHVATSSFPTQQAATDYANDMIRLGLADSAGIWHDDKQVAVLGLGR
jgi:hypothetical protein